MKLPNSVFETRPWRIHDIADDFKLEDVWALPVDGGADDFAALLKVFSSLDFPGSASLPARVLWGVRDLLGRAFGLGRISAPGDGSSDDTAGQLPIPGTTERSLVERLPDDLRATVADLDLRSELFVPLYRTADEYAAELSNRTVHAVLHLGWADRADGRYRGEMAVLVKPRGLFGQSYMALIEPFRHAVVYPALMRHIERAWIARTATVVAA